MNDKTILIPGLRAFYDLMRQHEDIIFRDPTLATIHDYLTAAYTGCSCRKKKNEDSAFELYRIINIRSDMNVLNELKIALNASTLLFFHDNKHLFNI